MNDNKKNHNQCAIQNFISRESEKNRISEILEELRNLRNRHSFEDGYRPFYNTVCDKLDVLESKLIHGL